MLVIMNFIYYEMVGHNDMYVLCMLMFSTVMMKSTMDDITILKLFHRPIASNDENILTVPLCAH